MSLENITVNGVPLQAVVAIEIAKEVHSFTKPDVKVKTHIVTRRVRNHSGARSGRCRIIYSAEVR